MQTVNHRDRFIQFLDQYARKDLPSIVASLLPDVRLRDWNVAVQGREAVEAFFRQNFADAATLNIEVLQLHSGSNSVSGELCIRIDGCIELYAVDVIEFNAQGQIATIRSYKGRGD